MKKKKKMMLLQNKKNYYYYHKLEYPREWLKHLFSNDTFETVSYGRHLSWANVVAHMFLSIHITTLYQLFELINLTLKVCYFYQPY